MYLAYCGPFCFTTISIVVYFSTAACSRVAEAMFALACIVTYATVLHVQLTICMQLFGTRYPYTRSTFANRMLSAEEP